MWTSWEGYTLFSLPQVRLNLAGAKGWSGSESWKGRLWRALSTDEFRFFNVSNKKLPPPNSTLLELHLDVNSLRQWYIELIEE